MAVMAGLVDSLFQVNAPKKVNISPQTVPLTFRDVVNHDSHFQYGSYRWIIHVTKLRGLPAA